MAIARSAVALQQEIADDEHPFGRSMKDLGTGICLVEFALYEKAAVILTTAERETPDFATAREELSEELGIPVSAVLGDQLARWFLAHLEAVAAD